MKFLLAVALCAVAANALDAGPVTRVVGLLQDIQKSAEEDGKAEEKLYFTFVCWAKGVIETKTASNEVANKRIAELETYIEDISSGKIEFTTERPDLEKELGEINAAIEQATTLRKKEKEEFLSAEDEMKKAIAAMDKAIVVLKEATAAKEGGSFVQASTVLSASERMEETDLLARAAELGARVLSEGDALFLKRLLSGDVPKADWKKLNRKAGFKSQYKARSGKIQDLLADLQKTITTNLADAQTKEEQDQANFDKLMESKEAEKSTCEDALNNMEAENSARDAIKEESQDEVDALTTQVANDEKYIKQTTNSAADMKVAYKDRKELRAGEIAAIDKAIEVLNSDDARDNQKKSFASDGGSFLFLQEQSYSASAARRMTLAATSAIKQGDTRGRLAGLAGFVSLNRGSHFTEVLEAIDKMVGVLKEEEKTDLVTKETCEKDRAAATREAVLKSRGMDELTEANNKLSAQIDEIKNEIIQKNEAIAATEKSVVDATQQRERENTDSKTAERDDKMAKETVAKALDVLKSFYEDNGLMFAQQPAGEAPPPPPPQFDAPYGGKTDQAASIFAILEMIIADVEKDMEKAKAAEAKAVEDFEIFKTESETQIQALNEEVTALEGKQGEKENSVTQNVKDRSTMHEELVAVMKLIADAKPGCDFFTINFPSRVKNRHIELDGLDKAKAILKGGSFNAAPDPNREMSVGDNFLQRRK